MAIKEIGTSPNQLTTIGELGDMAFQHRDAVSFGDGRGGLRHLDINAISQQINVTASKVFVYDTSKDTDGGQWRKRTQHTSWYNEQLNTTTRGSRREFPSVAILVGGSSGLTIYDGDDPALPMWMVFNSGGSYPIEAAPIGAICALNGTILTGSNNGAGSSAFSELAFIHDAARLHQDSAINQARAGSWALNGIAYRNRGGNSWMYPPPIHVKYAMPTRYTNDIAMIALPGAPIDPVTQLPVPTIAIAIAGGVGTGGVVVIRDNGTLYSIVHGWNVSAMVAFDSDRDLLMHIGNASGQGLICKVPATAYSIDISSGGSYLLAGGNIYNTSVTPSLGSAIGGLQYIAPDPTGFSTNGANGPTNTLVKYAINKTDYTKSMVAYISSKYNSGWQVGNIKGAWLSDSTTEIISDGNLISNSDMSSGISGYTAYNPSNTSATSSAGAMLCTALVSGQLNGAYYIVNGLVVGKQYYIQCDFYTASTTSDLRIQISGVGLRNSSGQFANASGTRTVYDTFLATSTSHTLELLDYSSGASGRSFTVDNVYMKVAESDRSFRNNGLGVYGNLTKSQVAANSDVVGYSGFSASNYLFGPYIAAPGTGDFSICCWVNPSSSSTYEHWFNFGGGQSASTGFTLKAWQATSNYLSPYFYYSGGDLGTGNTSGALCPIGSWSHIVAGRRNGFMYIYINGQLKTVSSTSNSVNFTDTFCRIGKDASFTGEVMYGSISMVRYSTTFPSDSQITKMYNDEWALFLDNSKSTLYGTSDTVNGVAYDEDTGLLHAGTSSGRSMFEGLRRIDNTISAVSTGISASNGTVAEQ